MRFFRTTFYANSAKSLRLQILIFLLVDNNVPNIIAISSTNQSFIRKKLSLFLSKNRNISNKLINVNNPATLNMLCILRYLIKVLRRFSLS